MTCLPNDSDNPLDLADWLELTALEADDANASAGDLSSALQIAAGRNSVEQLTMEAMLELEHREKATGDAYPFEVRGGLLQRKRPWRDCVAYVFCLCLSYFGGQVQSQVDPRGLFEELAAVAAKEYITGRVFPFGVACRQGTSPFEGAVNALCGHLREGGGFMSRSNRRPRDDKVDIVAWKSFDDEWPSRLIMLASARQETTGQTR